jgi:photosystem II stability/assembly factor-like uncharacterized protein
MQAFDTLDSQSTATNLTPATNQPSKSSKKIYYMVFVVLLIIVGIAGGFFYLKNKTSLLSGKVELNNKTFSQWKQIEQIGNQECREIGIKNDKIFVSCEDHLYKSFDGGKTWQVDSFWDNLNSQPTQAKIKLNDLPYQIVFDNSGNTVFAASGMSGVYRSKDGGQSWESVNNGVRTKFSEKDGVGVSALVISPSNNKILYAIAGDYTLIKTENMGDTWQTLPDLTSVNGLSINSSDPNQIYLRFAPTIKSSDGGKTLMTGEDALPKTSSINSHYVDPNNFRRIIVGGLGGIFTSTNGGNSWESLGDTLQGKDLPKNISKSNQISRFDTITSTGQKWITSLSVNPSDPNIIAAGTKADGVIASQDGGKTWVEVNKGLVLQKQNQREFIIVEKVKWSDDGSRLYLLSNHGVYTLE